VSRPGETSAGAGTNALSSRSTAGIVVLFGPPRKAPRAVVTRPAGDGDRHVLRLPRIGALAPGMRHPPRGRTRDERTEPGAGEGRGGGNGDGPTGRRRQVAGGARSRSGSTEKGSTAGGAAGGGDGRRTARTPPRRR